MKNYLQKIVQKINYICSFIIIPYVWVTVDISKYSRISFAELMYR